MFFCLPKRKGKEEALSWRLSKLAQLIGAELKGEDQEIRGINALEWAREDEISFLESSRFLQAALASKAQALIVPPPLAAKVEKKSLLVVPNVRAAVAKIAQVFYKPPSPPSGVSTLAFISEDVKIHPSAKIYPFVYVGSGACIEEEVVLYPGVFVGEGVSIGRESIIYPNAVIYPRTKLGARTIVHAGVVIGSDGFGYAQEEGKHLKIPHFGRVEIAEEVEIGANTTIDRATFGVTRIGAGTKLDNLIQIAHNVSLGRSCAVAAQVGFTGSVEVGDYVMIGGQAGVNNKIGDRAMVAARAGVAKEVPAGKVVAGAPAMDIRHWRRCVAAYEKLPEILKELRLLRQRVAELEEALNERDRP